VLEGDEGCCCTSNGIGCCDGDDKTRGRSRRRRPVAERRQLLVHLRERESDEGRRLQAELHDGTALCGETLLRLACDAGLVMAKTDDKGDVLDVGRLSRTTTPAIGRALTMRDGHCQFPGCTHSAFVEAHHLEHWAQGGETKLDNLTLLCAAHHERVHEGGFGLARADDGQLVFTDPDGRRIEPVPAPEPIVGDAVVGLTDSAIDRRTSLPDWDGRPLDLQAAVGALAFRVQRAAKAPTAVAL